MIKIREDGEKMIIRTIFGWRICCLENLKAEELGFVNHIEGCGGLGLGFCNSALQIL